MIVIADSNIFYSALIAPQSTIAGILKEKRNIQFLVSDYLIEEIQEHLFHEAISIVKDVDIDDAFFVALHFHTKHKIWTGDKVMINGLKKKGYDICITTNQLKKSLYKK